MREEVNCLREELARRNSELDEANRRLSGWKALHERATAANKTVIQQLEAHGPVFGLTAQANRFQIIAVREGTNTQAVCFLRRLCRTMSGFVTRSLHRPNSLGVSCSTSLVCVCGFCVFV